jgi:N-acylneuraminate cytidylyltransferase
MRILGIIPARGGSEGIPKKNIVPLCGIPLIAYTIKAAQLSSRLDRVYVSTDDLEIAHIAKSYNCPVLMRPPSISTAYSTTLSVLVHVLNQLSTSGYRPDAVMTLQPTSPLRTNNHIDEAAALFLSDPLADSLVSCVPVPHIYHPNSVMRLSPAGYLQSLTDSNKPSRRQDKEPLYARNGAAIYITRSKRLTEYIFGGRLIPYMMDWAASIDIDTIDDLNDAERHLSSSGAP